MALVPGLLSWNTFLVNPSIIVNLHLIEPNPQTSSRCVFEHLTFTHIARTTPAKLIALHLTAPHSHTQIPTTHPMHQKMAQKEVKYDITKYPTAAQKHLAELNKAAIEIFTFDPEEPLE